MSIAGIACGAAAVAGDEESGQLELKFAHAVTRAQVVLERALALALRIDLLSGIVFLLISALNGPSELCIGSGHLAGATVPDWPCSVERPRFAPAHLPAAKPAARRRGQRSPSSATYSMPWGAKVLKWTWLLYLSPYHWAHGNSTAAHGADWSAAAGLWSLPSGPPWAWSPHKPTGPRPPRRRWGVFVPCPGNAPLRTVGIMTTEVSMPEVEVLSAQECWRLSRSVSVGRLAVWVYDYLDIFPINHKVDHRALNFRTGVETKLSSALAGSPIALEADHVSPDEGIAWSVTVKGQATSMERTQEVQDTADLLLTPWETGRRHRLIRVIPDTVCGRRFKISAPLTWSDPLDDATRAGLE